jgi:predicted membrane metal-binding protein
MLRIIAIILIVGWLLGFSFHVAGGLIHIVLVIAVVIFLVDLLGGRRV